MKVLSHLGGKYFMTYKKASCWSITSYDYSTSSNMQTTQHLYYDTVSFILHCIFQKIGHFQMLKTQTYEARLYIHTNF
jgi:hypothetical protein